MRHKDNNKVHSKEHGSKIMHSEKQSLGMTSHNNKGWVPSISSWLSLKSQNIGKSLTHVSLGFAFLLILTCNTSDIDLKCMIPQMLDLGP